MRQLGRIFPTVLIAGMLSTTFVALGAILQWPVMVLTALSMTLACLLAATTLVYRDLRRLSPHLKSSRPERGQVPRAGGTLDAAGEVRLAQQVTAGVEEVILHLSARGIRMNSRPYIADSRQVPALLWLQANHQPPGAGPLTLPGAMPEQFAAAMSMVERQRPRRVLAVDFADAGVWLAHAVARLGGEATLVTSDPAEAARLQDIWRVIARASTATEQVLSAVTTRPVPLISPGTPHSYLDWFDLSGLTLGDGYNLVIVAVPDARSVAATRPVLPLLERLLAPGGNLVAIEADGDRPVSAAWAGAPGQLDACASPTLTTLRNGVQ